LSNAVAGVPFSEYPVRKNVLKLSGETADMINRTARAELIDRWNTVRGRLSRRGSEMNYAKKLTRIICLSGLLILVSPIPLRAYVAGDMAGSDEVIVADAAAGSQELGA